MGILKIYGCRRRVHREHWIVKGKGVYKEVRRDSGGKWIYIGQWSPKKPTGKEIYDETEPIIIEYTTGKDAYAKVRKEIREWEWSTPIKVES